MMNSVKTKRSLSGTVAFISIASGMVSLFMLMAWLSTSISRNFDRLFESEVSDRVAVFEERIQSDIDRLSTNFLQIAKNADFRELFLEGNRRGVLSYLFEQNQQSTISPFSMIYVNRENEIGWTKTAMLGSDDFQEVFFNQIERDPPEALVSIRALGVDGQKKLFLVFSTGIIDPDTLSEIGQLRAVLPLLSHAQIVGQAMEDTKVDCLLFVFDGQRYPSLGNEACIEGARETADEGVLPTYRTTKDGELLEFVYSDTKLIASFLTDGLEVVLGNETQTLLLFRQQLYSFGLVVPLGLLMMAVITFYLIRRILRREMGRLLSFVAASTEAVKHKSPDFFVSEFDQIASEFALTRDRLIEKERERQRADRDIAELNQQLHHAHSQKMESLGVLTSGVAHDFNNILAIISASLEQLAPEGQSKQELQIASHAVERATLLVRQLLTYAKQDHTETAAIDQARELESLKGILTPTFGPRYKLTVTCETKDWIEADPDLFDATLMNLAINARDAMPDGGSIQIESRKATRANLLQAQLPTDANMVAISITDSGPGIPLDIAARIFEPFFTTKPVGKGTGLGLSMAFGFASSAGGSIFLDRKYTNGCRLVLVLPVAQAPPSTEIEPARTNALSLNGQRILVVDDEVALGEMTARFLASREAIVRNATSVQKALEILDDEAPFDIILTDLNIPDGTGHDVIAVASQKPGPEPVYFLMSGNFDKCETVEHPDATTVHRFPKPFRLVELAEFIVAKMQPRPVPQSSNGNGSEKSEGSDAVAVINFN